MGMLPGHLYKLKKAVEGLKNQTTIETIVNRTPIVSLNTNTTATDGGTGTAGPAADSCAAACAAPTPYVVTATKRKSPRYDLPELCKTTEEVRLESLRHSTALGSSAMRDNKKSSKRKIVYRCKSVLSKKLKKEMGPDVAGTQYKCDHCLTWNWTKKKRTTN